MISFKDMWGFAKRIMTQRETSIQENGRGNEKTMHSDHCKADEIGLVEI